VRIAKTFRVMAAACVIAVSGICAAQEVMPGYRIELPRDAGSHPGFRTEWWYLTGSLQDDTGKRRGFQVTFFRSRNPAADDNPSRFAPRQLLFAHAAISDADHGRLLRAERTARAGLGLAEANADTLDVFIDEWSLRSQDGNLVVHVLAEDFSLDLSLQPTQPILLHGDGGYSRKGPTPAAASYYYSQPQMRVRGSVSTGKRKFKVTGEAWFDHEWSNTYMDRSTVGWDWLGLNFTDGTAVMAFRMRNTRGAVTWASGTIRKGSESRILRTNEMTWTPLRSWRSPRTAVNYPVAWSVELGTRRFIVRPLMDDQENDARGSVGILYWEGAVEATEPDGTFLGRGYLELTGYGEPVEF
jgi:predicted secreted hydrolase